MTEKRKFIYAVVLGVLVAGLGIALGVQRGRGDTSWSNLLLLIAAVLAFCLAIAMSIRSRPSKWDKVGRS
jgi:hypothetical protein